MVPAAQAATRSDGSVPAPAQVTQLVTSVPASTLNRVGIGEAATRSPSHYFGIIKGDGHFTSDGKPTDRDRRTRLVPSLRGEQLGVGGGAQPVRNLQRAGRGQHRHVFLQARRGSVQSEPALLFSVHARAQLHGCSLPEPLHQLRAGRAPGRQRTQPPKAHSARAALARGGSSAGSHSRDRYRGCLGLCGSGYDPGTLAHKTWSQIAGSLADPHNRIAREVDGLANLFTAAICSATNGRPGSVCKHRGVRAAAAAVLRKYPCGRRRRRRDPRGHIRAACRARRRGLLRACCSARGRARAARRRPGAARRVGAGPAGRRALRAAGEASAEPASAAAPR